MASPVTVAKPIEAQLVEVVGRWVDFTNVLHEDELLEGTPTVTVTVDAGESAEAGDLTIDDIAVNVAALRPKDSVEILDVNGLGTGVYTGETAIGKGVQFTCGPSAALGTYRLEVKADTTYGNIRAIDVLLKVVAG